MNLPPEHPLSRAHWPPAFCISRHRDKILIVYARDSLPILALLPPEEVLEFLLSYKHPRNEVDDLLKDL